MGFTWSERIAVGHPLIDQQHQELIQRFNSFLDSCQQAKARDRVEALFDFLDSYIKDHFRQEELLMAQQNYPLLTEHRAAHHSYIEQLGELRRNLVEQGASSALVIHTNQMLLDWIVRHIKNADLEFGSFLKHGGGRRA